MDESKRKYDRVLLKIAQKHRGGIEEFLDSFFGFLYRKTDFFLGAAAGIPRRTVLNAMETYEMLAEQKRNVVVAKHNFDKRSKEIQEQFNIEKDMRYINSPEKGASSSLLDVATDTEEVKSNYANTISEVTLQCIDIKQSTILNQSPVNPEVSDAHTACSTSILSSGKKRKTKKMPFKNITPIPSRRRVGRPKLEFDTYRAKHLISLGFTMAQVCNTLGISDGTLRRFRDVNKDCKLYDKISDEDLDSIISEIKKEHTHIGEKRLLGLLKGRGIRIQRKRLRESIHRVDPCGPKKRCNAGIALVNARASMIQNEAKPKTKRPRKVSTSIQVPLNVAGPNNIWRIDTITKLERWKINITFGIDLFSRVVVFIIASGFGTHLSESDKLSFKKAVKKYSCPDSIVTDKRAEKELIWKEMQESKGYASVELSDKLERIQWITIIKNDLNLNIFQTLSEIFYEFESECALNVSNNVDIFCLHFVYLPRINKLLDDFVTSYNACPIPRGSGATPLQMFYAHSQNAGDEDILPNLSSSWENTTIDITFQDSCPLPEEKIEDLYDYVQPLEESEDNGKELYYRTCSYVTQYLRSQVEEENVSPESDVHVKSETDIDLNTDEDLLITNQFNLTPRNVNPDVIMNKFSVIMNSPLTSIVSNNLSFDEQSSSSEGSHIDRIVMDRDVEIGGNINLDVDEGSNSIYAYYDTCHS